MRLGGGHVVEYLNPRNTAVDSRQTPAIGDLRAERDDIHGRKALFR
jgi:hypothetical protein